jgi:hypothetical protein
MSFRHPAFEMPPAPPGWDDYRVDLIRIVAPRGDAIAWFAPALGATCVGFAVRTEESRSSSWRQVFCSSGPTTLLANPNNYGCAVLWPLSDTDASPDQWQWQFVERDPTAAIFATTIAQNACDGDHEAVQLQLTASLESGRLSMTVDATAMIRCPDRFNLGFRAAMAPGILLLPACETARIAPSRIAVPFTLGDHGAEPAKSKRWAIDAGKNKKSEHSCADSMSVAFFMDARGFDQ